MLIYFRILLCFQITDFWAFPAAESRQSRLQFSFCSTELEFWVEPKLCTLE